MAKSRKELATALLPLVDKVDKTADSKKLAKAIALYLAENRQTKELDGLMRDLVRLRADAGVIEATATSAHPLTPAVKKELVAIITKTHKANKVILNEVIDPQVIGGVRLETNEQQLDVTVAQKLHQLKQAIA